MSSEYFYLNYADVECEFDGEYSIDKLIKMLLEYQSRNFVCVKVLDGECMAFYREETEEQRNERLEKERIAEEQRKQREIRAAEKREKNKKIKEVTQRLKKAEKLINNSDFVSNAPREIVIETLQNYNITKQELSELTEKKLNVNLDILGATV
jgi:hypothetical protein